MGFSIDIQGSFRLGRLVFGPDRMQKLAEVQEASQRERIAAGINTSDGPAKPLNQNYARAKTLRGLAGVRDMRFSGLTLSQMGVTEVGSDMATIGFADPTAERRAYFSNSIDPMFGISPADAQKTVAAAGAELPNILAEAIQRK